MLFFTQVGIIWLIYLVVRYKLLLNSRGTPITVLRPPEDRFSIFKHRREKKPCFSALPPSAAITASTSSAITAARVHCFCPSILKERRRQRRLNALCWRTLWESLKCAWRDPFSRLVKRSLVSWDTAVARPPRGEFPALIWCHFHCAGFQCQHFDCQSRLPVILRADLVKRG